MPSLRDLDVIQSFNAPTRAAALRRRRVRKMLAALSAAGATALILGGHDADAADPTQSSAVSTSSLTRKAAHGLAPLQREGRQAVSLRADPATVAAIQPGDRVDVWGPDGTRLVARAPATSATDPAGPAGRVDVGKADAVALLVGVTPTEARALARTLSDGSGRAPLVTISSR